MTVQKKILDLTGSQYLVQKVKSAINDVDSSLSTHIADTDIHVTTADKNRWNNQTYVFRYSSTTLTASSTNSNTLLDNTDNLKVGDKVIDSSGVLFSITAIDTQNSTFTIGSALIDLAQDSDVVHKSGNETVAGEKTFTNSITFSSVSIADVRWKSLVNQTIDLNDCYITRVGTISGYYSASVSSGSNISNKAANTAFIMLSLTTRYISASDYQIYQIFYGSNNEKYTRTCSNGTWTAWVKDTDKFVTTDTNQTISGNKTFSDTLTIYNSDSSQNTKNLTISSSKIQVGDTSNSDAFGIMFNAGSSYVSRITAFKDTSGTQNLQFGVRTKDSSNNFIGAMIRLRSYANGFNSFESDVDNLVSLGSSSNKWKNVQTKLINGITPSSLSMPVAPSSTSYVDISSYITVLDSSVPNTYTPPSNGYITFSVTGNLVQIFHDYGLQAKWTVQVGNANRGFIPVLGGVEVKIYITASSVDKFWFIPCQGNI